MDTHGKKSQNFTKVRPGLIKVLLSVFILALVLFLLWTFGLEEIYASLILYGAYLPVGLLENTSISLSINAGDPVYTVTSIINLKEYTWSLSGELFLLPVVLLLSWQITLFLFVSPWQAMRCASFNLIVLVITQILFLFLLTMYWKSDLIRVIHDMMNNNLIILVLFLIIKDIIRLNLILKQKPKPIQKMYKY